MLLQAPLYTTEYGAAYVGNSLELDQLAPNSIDLVLPLLCASRQKMEMLSKKKIMLNGFLLLQKVC